MVTAKAADVIAAVPVSFGAMKSASDWFGSPSFFSICCRRKWNVRQHLRPRFVGVELHVVAHRIRREETVNRARGEQFFADDFVEQLLRIREELARLLAVFFVLQDRRITPAQFPRVEERRPIDELAIQRQSSGKSLDSTRTPVNSGCGDILRAASRSACDSARFFQRNQLLRAGPRAWCASRVLLLAILRDESRASARR